MAEASAGDARVLHHGMNIYSMMRKLLLGLVVMLVVVCVLATNGASGVRLATPAPIAESVHKTSSVHAKLVFPIWVDAKARSIAAPLPVGKYLVNARPASAGALSLLNTQPADWSSQLRWLWRVVTDVTYDTQTIDAGVVDSVRLAVGTDVPPDQPDWLIYTARPSPGRATSSAGFYLQYIDAAGKLRLAAITVVVFPAAETFRAVAEYDAAGLAQGWSVVGFSTWAHPLLAKMSIHQPKPSVSCYLTGPDGSQEEPIWMEHVPLPMDRGSLGVWGMRAGTMRGPPMWTSPIQVGRSAKLTGSIEVNARPAVRGPVPHDLQAVRCVSSFGGEATSLTSCVSGCSSNTVGQVAVARRGRMLRGL